MEKFELDELHVASMGVAVERLGMQWLHLPIRDRCAPSAWWDRYWQEEAGPRVRRTLNSGGRVLIHCRGGIGRTGVVAARLLIEYGVTPDAAVARVRLARPRAIETDEQMAYVQCCTALPAETR